MTELQQVHNEIKPVDRVVSAASALYELERRADEPCRVLRVREEPAFVLTSWPWKESSLIAEFFTRRHGHIPLSVRGAKRPGSQFRGLINAFCPLIISYSGKGEVRNLTSARWLGGLTPISGEGLLSGFYLNELVLRLTAREDPQPQLFDCYMRALAAVSEGSAVQRALREFEVDVLRLTGWGQVANKEDLFEDCVVRDGELVPLRKVRILPQEFVVRAPVAKAILTRSFEDESLLIEVRNVLRLVIRYYVGQRELATRRTMSGWQQF